MLELSGREDTEDVVAGFEALDSVADGLDDAREVLADDDREAYSIIPFKRPAATARSKPLTDAARTRTSTSPADGSGVGISVTFGSASKSSRTSARIAKQPKEIVNASSMRDLTSSQRGLAARWQLPALPSRSPIFLRDGFARFT